MLKLFTGWFGASRGHSEWSAAAAWARGAGYRFARSRDGSGFVIEPGQPGADWRLEWGTSQRHYIAGAELRVRGEAPATGDLQLLVMSRPLMSLLEQQVFEDYTDGNQTRMDDGTPEEMRWLVLFTKMPRAELGALSERFGVLASLPRAAPLWLAGELASQLAVSSSWLADHQPLVLAVHRGRLTLRCQLAQPELPSLQAALGLFGAALEGARRVGDELARGAIGGDRPSSWGPPSAMPGVEAKST